MSAVYRTESGPCRYCSHPGEYRWSSYGYNRQGERADLLSHHSVYRGLGRTSEERQAAYRELFRHELEPGVVDQIRQATNGSKKK